jgi:serine/threonine protein kinase
MRVYSFLEYFPEGSVGGMLQKYGKFEDEVVRSFSQQIIDGLAYMHTSGIIHCVSFSLVSSFFSL